MFNNRKHVLQVNFEKMIGEMKKSAILEIRRLSTESSAVQKFQPLATQWKWYWRDQRNKWIIYGETVNINTLKYKPVKSVRNLKYERFYVLINKCTPVGRGFPGVHTNTSDLENQEGQLKQFLK